jgi:hypothetical protein
VSACEGVGDVAGGVQQCHAAAAAAAAAAAWPLSRSSVMLTVKGWGTKLVRSSAAQFRFNAVEAAAAATPAAAATSLSRQYRQHRSCHQQPM